MAWQPISKQWPGKRVILLVHGIGDASPGYYDDVIQALAAIPGLDLNQFAVYPFLYDFIVDWMKEKAQFKQLAGALTKLQAKLGFSFGGDEFALEVGVNFLLQRVPGFYPTDEKGPGPLEVVASYDAAYLTVVDEEPELISTAGFGIRYYLLGDGWGEEDGLTGFLKPGYFSLGVLIAPEEDGALVWPWRGEERLGGFFTWGELKLAYVGGDEDRFMVSRELQMIPWLF